MPSNKFKKVGKFTEDYKTRWILNNRDLISYWHDRIMPAIWEMGQKGVPPKLKDRIMERTALACDSHPEQCTHVLRAETADVLDLDYHKLTQKCKDK